MDKRISQNNIHRANLTLFISDVGIQAVLLYENLAIKRSYILTDFLTCDCYDLFVMDGFAALLKDFLTGLSSKWNWIFFDKISSGDVDVFSIKALATEGVGLSSFRVIIDKDNPYFQNILEDIRSISPEIKILFNDETPSYKLMELFFLKYGYSDVIKVNLNIHKITLERYKFKNLKETLANIHLPKFDFFKEKKLHNNVEALFPLATQKEFKAFLTLVSEEKHILHNWINFINNINPFDNSYVVQDLVRSFLLLNLMSLYYENKDKFKNLFSGAKSLLWIEGSLVNLVSESILFSTIVDAFQLRGDFDVISSFGKGSSILFMDWLDFNPLWTPLKSNIVTMSKYSTAENMKEKNSHKVFLRSTLHRKDGSREMLYAMTDKVNILDINDFRGILEFRNMNNDILYTVDFNKEPFPVKKYFIDSRFRPIVYGKSPKENKNNFIKWFDDYNV